MEKENLFIASLIFIVIASIISVSALSILAHSQKTINPHHTFINYFTEEDRLIVNNAYCLQAVGDSMQPTAFSGNTLCFKNYEDEKLFPGNIIHYSLSDGGDVAHRVIYADRKKSTILVQGDNNFEQELINISQVRGILMAILFT